MTQNALTPPVAAFWCRIPSRGNVGDRLTPWLIERVTGRYPRFARPEDPGPKVLAAGSIAAYAREGCIVWGAGVMSRDERLSARAEYRAVRGPLTREIAASWGARCPAVYGDPALLLPRFYRPEPGPREGLGLAPHFSDKPRLDAERLAEAGIRLLDVQARVETFIDQAAGCAAVAASSLHGLIISHAYGVPAVWVKFADLPSGDDSKFYDYFRSVGLEAVQPLAVQAGRLDAERLAERAVLPAALPDLDLLWERCPFR